jgi:hypothetical protein
MRNNKALTLLREIGSGKQKPVCQYHKMSIRRSQNANLADTTSEI